MATAYRILGIALLFLSIYSPLSAEDPASQEYGYRLNYVGIQEKRSDYKIDYSHTGNMGNLAYISSVILRNLPVITNDSDLLDSFLWTIRSIPTTHDGQVYHSYHIVHFSDDGCYVNFYLEPSDGIDIRVSIVKEDGSSMTNLLFRESQGVMQVISGKEKENGPFLNKFCSYIWNVFEAWESGVDFGEATRKFHSDEMKDVEMMLIQKNSQGVFDTSMGFEKITDQLMDVYLHVSGHTSSEEFNVIHVLSSEISTSQM